MPLDMEVIGLDRGDFVLHGTQFRTPKRGWSPQFSTHVYCGQTDEWIKTAFGMEVDFGPGPIVLDGDQLPSAK